MYHMFFHVPRRMATKRLIERLAALLATANPFFDAMTRPRPASSSESWELGRAAGTEACRPSICFFSRGALRYVSAGSLADRYTHYVVRF